MSRITPEGYEKREVKRYLDRIKAYHFWPVQTGYGQATVDCLACINGDFWLIEVKAEGQKPTPRQFAVLANGRAAGAKICWGTAAQIIANVAMHRTIKE